MSRRNFLQKLLVLPFSRTAVAALAPPVATVAAPAAALPAAVPLGMPLLTRSKWSLINEIQAKIKKLIKSHDDLSVFMPVAKKLPLLFEVPYYTRETLLRDREKVLRGESIERIALKGNINAEQVLGPDWWQRLVDVTALVYALQGLAVVISKSILPLDAPENRKIFAYNVVYTRLVKEHILLNKLRIYYKAQLSVLRHQTKRVIKLCIKYVREARKQGRKNDTWNLFFGHERDRALHQSIKELVEPRHYKMAQPGILSEASQYWFIEKEKTKKVAERKRLMLRKKEAE